MLQRYEEANGEVPEGYVRVGSRAFYTLRILVKIPERTHPFSNDIAIQNPQEALVLAGYFKEHNILPIITRFVHYNDTKCGAKTKPSESKEITFNELEEIVRTGEPNPTAMVPVDNPLHVEREI